MALQDGDLFVAQKDATKYNVTYEQLKDAIQAGLGKPVISDTPPDPAGSSEGDFWWDDQTGQLYIFYVDPSDDRYWVTASPSGTPNASMVSVSSLPPVSPQEGALWWKDDAGILYVYYSDPSGDQYWVDTNPMGTPAGASHTYVQDTAPEASASTEGDFWLDSNTGVLYVYYTDANSSQWIASTGFNGYGASGAVFDFPTTDLEAGVTTYTPSGSTLTYIWNGQGWALQGTGGGSGGGDYTLPIASNTLLGGIKVGTGLNINSTTGVLNADAGGYALPPATTSTLGGVIVGTGLSVTADGTTTPDIATSSAAGIASFSTGLSITAAGVVTVDNTIYPTLAADNTFTGDNTFDKLISGTVTQSNSLATARTLWGQSFNGTANITGALTGADSITGTNLALNGTTTLQLKHSVDAGLQLFNGDASFKTTFDTSGLSADNTITIPSGSGTLAYLTSTVTAAQKVVRTATSIATDEDYRLELGAPNNSTGALNTFVVSDGTRLTYNPSTNTLSDVGTVNATAKVKAPTGEFTTLSDGLQSATVSSIIQGATASDGVPTGSVFYFAAATAPSGYLECDGAEVSRTTYADLFAVTSTTFGAGDGASTFNLPDLRGEFVRGYDNGRNVDQSRQFGSSQDEGTGVNGLTLTDPGHNHSYTQPINGQHAGGTNSGRDTASQSSTTGNQTTGITFTSTDTETRPRNVALLPCIKT